MTMAVNHAQVDACKHHIDSHRQELGKLVSPARPFFCSHNSDGTANSKHTSHKSNESQTGSSSGRVARYRNPHSVATHDSSQSQSHCHNM